jgi:murein DD-endopeptidase MepM/ murein hydrolase activator NlpD
MNNVEKMQVHEISIHPGEARWLEIPSDDVNARFFCRNKEQKISKKENRLIAIVVESYFSDFKKINCELKVGDEVTHKWNLVVKPKEFPSEKLKVNPKTIKLSQVDQARVEKEQVILDAIYASSSNELYFQKSFIQPLNSRITSYYGIRRIYNNQKKGQHLGVDFRAPIGMKVPSTNRGRVVFAGDLFYTGGTVIIDHGLDIFSVYGHLSEVLAKSGDIVERGDVIGLSGNTGRSSGPHLHWGIKIQGQYVDGISLIAETQQKLNE